jgi:hypothetical protein
MQHTIEYCSVLIQYGCCAICRLKQMIQYRARAAQQSATEQKIHELLQSWNNLQLILKLAVKIQGGMIDCCTAQRHVSANECMWGLPKYGDDAWLTATAFFFISSMFEAKFWLTGMQITT